MSYIRCLTNPEGLYIYENLNGNLEILRHNKDNIICNAEDFYQFILNWFEYCDDKYSYKNISINDDQRNDVDDFKTFIKIDNDVIEMWHVTWMYIVYEILNRKINIYNLLYPEIEEE